MNRSLALKNKLSLYFLFIISFFIIIYLFYFLINGDRGVISYYKIKNQNISDKLKLDDLTLKNDELVDKINKLHHNSIDLDFLDEKIRKSTGFINKNEVLILFD